MGRHQRVTPLALAVLRLLQERSMHPYEMQHVARERYWDNLFKLRTGSLYHAVDRLVHLKLIEPVDRERDGRRPERTVYGTTPAGRSVLSEEVGRMLATPAKEYPEFRLAVVLAESLEKDRVLSELTRRADELDRHIAGDAAALARDRERDLPARWSLSLRYRHRMLEAERKWVLEVLEELRSGRIEWQSECDVSDDDMARSQSIE